MCYILVKYVEYACGHRYPIFKQNVDCGRPECRVSRAHMTGPHDCSVTCDQEKRREEEGLVMEHNLARCAGC